MMYALDHFGRKITSVCAFAGAGVMAIVFANAVSDTQLLVAGFIMIFFVHVAGNSMQIFASEVFLDQRPSLGLRLGGRRRTGWRPPSSCRAILGCGPDGADSGVRLPCGVAGDCGGRRNPTRAQGEAEGLRRGCGTDRIGAGSIRDGVTGGAFSAPSAALAPSMGPPPPPKISGSDGFPRQKSCISGPLGEALNCQRSSPRNWRGAGYRSAESGFSGIFGWVSRSRSSAPRERGSRDARHPAASGASPLTR